MLYLNEVVHNFAHEVLEANECVLLAKLCDNSSSQEDEFFKAARERTSILLGALSSKYVIYGC